MGGGLQRAEAIINHQIALDDREASDLPRSHLRRLTRSLGLAPRRTVAMMTGANVALGGFATLRRGDFLVSAWCSAGCSNALRVGDRATVLSGRPGTINVAVAISRSLTVGALAEAIQIAVEGRVVAVQQATVVSRRSGLAATGTGTDCIAVAAPERPHNDMDNVIEYCGKHTVAGELIGRAVIRSCTAALHRCE
jgi:adenosylcobinamide amidohydrolase